MQETQERQVLSLGQEDPLEEGMAIHSSTLAGRTPWTGSWSAKVHSGEGNGTPLQYSCLESPMGGGAW